MNFPSNSGNRRTVLGILKKALVRKADVEERFFELVRDSQISR